MKEMDEMKKKRSLKIDGEIVNFQLNCFNDLVAIFTERELKLFVRRIKSRSKK